MNAALQMTLKLDKRGDLFVEVWVTGQYVGSYYPVTRDDGSPVPAAAWRAATGAWLGYALVQSANWMVAAGIKPEPYEGAHDG